MHRRQFLAGLTGLPLLGAGQVFAQSGARNKDVDVVIVGAGAAGLAAGRYLRRHGLSILVLEARKRTGGRVWTSTSPFGESFDYGCPQLDDINVNPLARDSRRGGVEFTDWVEEPTFWVNGRRSDANDEAMEEELEALVDAIDVSGARKTDTPLSRLSTRRSIADAFSLDITGPVAYGLEPENISTQILYNRLEGAGKARPKNGGIGDLLDAFARRLPITTDARVNRIVQNKDGVRVAGSFGVVRARACIVTVPPVLLARDEITFDPPLSDNRRLGLGKIETGQIERCALSFEPGDIPVLEGNPLYLWRERGPAVRLEVQAREKVPKVVMTYGGDMAASMAKEDLRAPLALLRDHLADLFGNDIRRRGKKAVVTRWAGDKESLGAVQMPGVGGQPWLEVLHAPHGDLVYFAGDAYDEDWPGRIGGAWASGTRAARNVRLLIKKQKSGR